jgi:hypothetical protein
MVMRDECVGAWKILFDHISSWTTTIENDSTEYLQKSCNLRNDAWIMIVDLKYVVLMTSNLLRIWVS